ncbi:NAD(P)/FAD-dependent oxidoreductase [Nocardia mangyaensis]|uniref:NAD(P)/FAD-dependent oxidoreductase n=1 Tax=Nocardia mangyaensis TaxID=2213200 RepID=UPI0026755CD7|nr:NAD(P)/FAD-dependent oxidoreductase [Nocardia mangyaensis]MDO3645386.1 NAD(P)/FAD-dependent oxidoreductase [Nocardia mangyaensis]
MTELNDRYDVVVLGGGAAGLNAALMLVRSRRAVAVIDAGSPRNAPAEGVHGLLARDGTPPAELVEQGRAEVRGYGGHVVSGEVVAVDRLGDGGAAVSGGSVGAEPVAPIGPVGAVLDDSNGASAAGVGDSAGSGAAIVNGSAAGDQGGAGAAHRYGFRVRLADRRTVLARRILVTTGITDVLPEIPGLREHWGHDVLHCPYCHGWEVRDRRIAVLASGPMSVHQALLFTQLSDDVVFLTHTAPALGAEDTEKLVARGVRIIEGEVVEVTSAADRLTGVRLADGTVVDREALVVAPRSSIRATFLTGLGLPPQPHPAGIGDHIPADPVGRTSVPGVWVAGNVTEPAAQVGAAAAAGAMAGAQINAELVMAETAQAVEELRATEGAIVAG